MKQELLNNGARLEANGQAIKNAIEEIKRLLEKKKLSVANKLVQNSRTEKSCDMVYKIGEFFNNFGAIHTELGQELESVKEESMGRSF